MDKNNRKVEICLWCLNLVVPVFNSIEGTNVVVFGALPPPGQIHNPELMHQIVHQGLFPDKPKNMTFLEYFQQFTDVNEDLAKVLERLEFNVLDMENLDNVIKLAEDVKRLKEIKMAALDAEKATRNKKKTDPQNARRDNQDVFHYGALPTAWTSETKRKILQFMQHSIYSTRYEINKSRNLRKRYENSTVFKMGVIYGTQMELKYTAGQVFSTMMKMEMKVSMLWFIFHYTKMMNLAQDIASNMELLHLLNRRLKDGEAHLDWYRGKGGAYTSMPTDSMEATVNDPENLYKKKKK